MRNRLVATLVLSAACGGSSPPPSAPAAVAVARSPVAPPPVVDAGAAAKGPPPVVFVANHAPVGKTWLPNGHLLIATASELLELDPAHPEAPWPRVALPRRALAIAGATGADRFVVLEEKAATLWDAAKMAPIAELAAPVPADESIDDPFGAIPAAVSADSSRVALGRSIADGVTLYDARDGAVVSKVPYVDVSPGEQVALGLSDDGGQLIVRVLERVDVLDATTGRRVLTRGEPRISSRGEGSSSDVCVVREGRILVTSVDGVESIDAKTGKRLARMNDPRMGTAMSILLSADGTRLLAGNYAWDPKRGGALVKQKSPAPDDSNAPFMGPPPLQARTDGQFSTSLAGPALDVLDANGQLVWRFGGELERTFAFTRRLYVLGGGARWREWGGRKDANEVALSQNPKPFTGEVGTRRPPPNVADVSLPPGATHPLTPGGLALDWAGQIGDQMYFDLGREPRGLERGFRYDAKKKTSVSLAASLHSAIAQFDDGAIERFGDRDEAARSIRCVVGDTLAPFSVCAADWDVRGRFEDAAR